MLTIVKLILIFLSYIIATLISVTLWEVCYYCGYIVIGIYIYKIGLQFLTKGLKLK